MAVTGSRGKLQALVGFQSHDRNGTFKDWPANWRCNRTPGQEAPKEDDHEPLRSANPIQCSDYAPHHVKDSFHALSLIGLDKGQLFLPFGQPTHFSYARFGAFIVRYGRVGIDVSSRQTIEPPFRMFE